MRRNMNAFIKHIFVTFVHRKHPFTASKTISCAFRNEIHPNRLKNIIILIEERTLATSCNIEDYISG